MKGVDFCERIHSLVFGGVASISLGDICFDRGRYDTSQEHYENAICLLQLGRFLPSWININRIFVVRARVMNNEKDVNLNELFKCYKDNKFKILEGWMLKYIGEILLNIDDHHMDEAEDWVKRAIEEDKMVAIKEMSVLGLKKRHGLKTVPHCCLVAGVGFEPTTSGL